MSEWKQFTIGSLGKVVTGRTPSENNPEYWGNHLPFFTPSDMDGRRFIEKTQRYLSIEGATALSRCIVPYGVGVSCIGWQMGKSILIDTPCVTNQQINSIITNTEIVDTLFLYYALQGRRDEIFRLGLGGSRTPILKKSDFERFPVLLPPLDEQREIARILGALDDKIDLNRRMNATLEATARALFQSWFVDFDPVHAKAEGRDPDGMDSATAALFPDSFEESALGMIPRGWRVKPLDRIADFQNGLALQKFPPEGDTFLPVIKIRELRQGYVDGNSDKASPNIRESCIVYDGDVLFSWSGSLLVDVWCGGMGALNQHLFKVTSTKYPKWFYLQWTQHHLEEFIGVAADKATTMGHIQRQHLSSALTVVPPGDVLAQLDVFISPLVEQMIQIRLESRTLAETRDALLPKLISGEVRIEQ